MIARISTVGSVISRSSPPLVLLESSLPIDFYTDSLLSLPFNFFYPLDLEGRVDLLFFVAWPSSISLIVFLVSRIWLMALSMPSFTLSVCWALCSLYHSNSCVLFFSIKLMSWQPRISTYSFLSLVVLVLMCIVYFLPGEIESFLLL